MTQEAQGSWNDCPEGQLHKMVDGIHGARRRRQIRQLSTLLSIVLLLAVAAVVANQQLGKRELTCAQVQRLFSDYEQKRLAANQNERVATHLNRCPHCRKRYDERRQESRGTVGELVAMLVP